MADYLYGGASLRALETAIIGRERIAKIVDARSLTDAYSLLSEYGVELIKDTDSGAVLREPTLLKILKDAYDTVLSLGNDSNALRLWLYPYDCNNLKACIKCTVRNINPLPLMFDFGTVPILNIPTMVKERSFQAFPKAMAEAASEAIGAYEKTKNPQLIDLLLDRACYCDMLNAANKSQNAYIQNLVTLKIDFTNLLMAVRVFRMNSGEAGQALLQNAWLRGGKLSLSDVLKGGEQEVERFLKQTPYASIFDALSPNNSLGALECAMDNAWMSAVQEAKWIPIGVEGMVSFLLAHEYEVKNLRIALSGKEIGHSPTMIRERIRESYV